MCDTDLDGSRISLQGSVAELKLKPDTEKQNGELEQVFSSLEASPISASSTQPFFSSVIHVLFTQIVIFDNFYILFMTNVTKFSIRKSHAVIRSLIACIVYKSCRI
jgi:hypothetical protein